MADVKIQMKIGEVEFSGEGEQAWVGAQLDRILKAAPTIVSSTPRTPQRLTPLTNERCSPRFECHGAILGQFFARQERVH
jgi:hypothetical protein